MSQEIILSYIKDNYELFTNVEKVIADYFLSSPAGEAFSSKNVSHKLFVSEAALSRFSKKCGFNGYREFVYKYKEEIPVFGCIEGLNQIQHFYQMLLRDMWKCIDENQIMRFCKMIRKDTSIIIFGMGSSYLAGMQMKYKFLRLGLTIDVANETDEIKIRSVLQKKNNLAIGISLSAKLEIVKALKQSKTNKADTVLITASNVCFEFIDEQIKVPSVKGLNTGHIISPQFPILVLLDICYYYYLKLNQKEFRKIQKSTVDVLD